MRSFGRPNAFDAVLNLSTSFGYFEDRHDDERVLTNIFESLRAGGTAVIDVIGKELMGRRGDRITDLPDGSTCIQRIQAVDESTTLKGEEVSLFGDFAGNGYGPQALRLSAVGRKPATAAPAS